MSLPPKCPYGCNFVTSHCVTAILDGRFLLSGPTLSFHLECPSPSLSDTGSALMLHFMSCHFPELRHLPLPESGQLSPIAFPWLVWISSFKEALLSQRLAGFFSLLWPALSTTCRPLPSTVSRLSSPVSYLAGEPACLSPSAALCCLCVSTPHGAEPVTGTRRYSRCPPKASPNSEMSRRPKDMHNACTWKKYVWDPCLFCSYFADQRPAWCQWGGEIDSF